MGKKTYITVNGIRLTLSEWAEELNISRQRVSQLYQAGRLEDYIKGIRRRPGRPQSKIRDEVRKLIDLPVDEIAVMVKRSASLVYRYKREICGKKKEI